MADELIRPIDSDAAHAIEQAGKAADGAIGAAVVGAAVMTLIYWLEATYDNFYFEMGKTCA
jgi:hypothetical protein